MTNPIEPEILAPEPTFDPNRFNAEPQRKANKFLVIVVMIFVLVMGAIGIGVFVAKKKISSYMQARAANAEVDKAKKEAEESDTRKAKVFQTISKPSDAALPSSFGDIKPPPGASGQSPTNAIPIIRNTARPMPNQPSNGGNMPPAPAMMLADGDQSNGASGFGGPIFAGGQGNNPDSRYMSPTPPNNLAEAEKIAAALRAAQGMPPTGASSGGAAAAPAGAAGGGQRIGTTVQEFAHSQALRQSVTATPQASAANLGDRSFLLARGSYIPCTLETQLNSTVSGYASCVLPQDIYSDNGKVLLIEKGSHVIGEYKGGMKIGDTRIAILWQRIKTTTGIVLDVDSPAADGVGTMGAEGYVENHWFERIGAAFLLSLVDDAVSIKVAQASKGSAATTPAATAATSKTMSEKVLESTINIPPTLYKNRGERLMVFVNRDVWFDSVYNLRQR